MATGMKKPKEANRSAATTSALAPFSAVGAIAMGLSADSPTGGSSGKFSMLTCNGPPSAQPMAGLQCSTEPRSSPNDSAEVVSTGDVAVPLLGDTV